MFSSSMGISEEERGDLVDEMDSTLAEIEGENAKDAPDMQALQLKAKELRVLCDRLIDGCDGPPEEKTAEPEPQDG